MHYGHDTRRLGFHVLADAAFKHCHVDHVFRLRNADAAGEFADAFGRISAPTHAVDSRHARIVPTGNQALRDQLIQLAFAGYGVMQFQPGKLDLLRMRRHLQLVQHPIVERTMVFKLKRTQRVRDVFQRIGNAMGVVVHRIDQPGIAGSNVVSAFDAIDHRIAQIDVGRGHVDLGAQGFRAIGELARPHATKQIEVVRNRT